MIYNQVSILRNFQKERVPMQQDWEERHENKNSKRESERGMQGEGRRRGENRVKLSEL